MSFMPPANVLGPDGLIILVVVGAVVLLGGSQIPKFARSLGSAQKEFKKGLEEGDPSAPEAAAPAAGPAPAVAPAPQPAPIAQAAPQPAPQPTTDGTPGPSA